MRFAGVQWLSLAAIAFAVATGQIMFKSASLALGVRRNLIEDLAANPVFWLALALYGGATIAWIVVIRDVPISRAYVFMALTYVFVPVLSAVFLKERIGLGNMAATLLIIAGIAVSALSQP